MVAAFRIKTQVIVFFLLSCIFYNCKREADLQQHIQVTGFFNPQPHEAVAPGTFDVIAAMRQQLTDKNVIDFLNWHGRPVWSQAIKLKRRSGDTVTYIIPVNRDGRVTAFFAASIISPGNVLFEMHRKSSLLSGAGEYSYAGIASNISKSILKYFDQKNGDVIMEKSSSAGSNFFPDEYCWYEYEPVNCGYSLANDNNEPGIAVHQPCYGWVLHCISTEDPGEGGGGGGGGSGGGGGTHPTGTGGGGGDDPTNPGPPEGPCFYSVPWYSIIPLPGPCEPDWPTTEPAPPEDTISVLTRLRVYSEAINDSSTAMFQRSMNSQHEWCFIIVKKGNLIYAKNSRTDNQPNYVYNNWTLAPGEILLGALHVHPDPSPILTNRPGPSHGDITALNTKGHQTIKNYISFIDCGNVRYAFVIEYPVKANSFFLNINRNRISVFDIYMNSLDNNPLRSTNYQQAGWEAVLAVIGSPSYSGIALYQSTNPAKTEYRRLP